MTRCERGHCVLHIAFCFGAGSAFLNNIYKVGQPMDFVISAKFLHDPARMGCEHIGLHPSVALPLYEQYPNEILEDIRFVIRCAYVVVVVV